MDKRSDQKRSDQKRSDLKHSDLKRSDLKRDERDEKYVKHIMSQTNYDEETARTKLQEFNGDFMQVLKDYMGIPVKKETNKFTSVNQEIYKQIRHSLDQTMKDYREKNPINIDQVVTNLQESEEREKDKR
jgi:gas vesicle protein